MLNYNDPKWKELRGGYQVSYDPTPALKKLESGQNLEGAWEELWNELHHQGDVGEASYAAVPELIRIHKEKGHLDWNLYGLVSTIEVERHRKKNPVLPKWLESSYRDAWNTLLELGLNDLRRAKDDTTVHAILSALALAKGSVKFGALLNNLDESEIAEYLDEHLAWSELYR